MEQEKFDETAVLNLPDPPELKRFEKMAQKLIDNQLYKSSKKGAQTHQQKLDELELKLYYCDVHGIPATFANNVYIVYGNFAVEMVIMDYLIAKGCPKAQIEPVEYDSNHCAIRAKRSEKGIWIRFEFNKDRVAQNGLEKAMYYQKDPQAAMRNYAIKDCYRTMFRKELGSCIYTPEDFGMNTNGNGTIESTDGVKAIPDKGATK